MNHYSNLPDGYDKWRECNGSLVDPDYIEETQEEEDPEEKIKHLSK